MRRGLDRAAGHALLGSCFDSQSIDTLCRGARLADVGRLTAETYQPRADTPLIDASVRAIKATEETIATRRDKPKVIVVFLSKPGKRNL